MPCPQRATPRGDHREAAVVFVKRPCVNFPQPEREFIILAENAPRDDAVTPVTLFTTRPRAITSASQLSRHRRDVGTQAIMFSIIRRRSARGRSHRDRRHDSRAAGSYVAVALFGLAGILAVFGPVHGTSRQAFYALIVLKLPICVALKRLFPALMTDEGRGYVV